MAEALSLADLHAIVLPQVPPLWPLPAGFWVLVLVVAALLWSARRQWQSWRRRSAYRRAGLAALGAAQSAHDVSVVLKRVALSAWPRAEVAALHDRAWVAFLNAHCRACHFGSAAFAHPSAPADADLRAAAARWVRRHRAPRGAGGAS